MFNSQNRTSNITKDNVKIRDEEQKFAAHPDSTAHYSLSSEVSGTESSAPPGPSRLCRPSVYCRFNETIWVASTAQPRVLRLCCTNRALFLRAPNVGRLRYACVLSHHAHARTYTRYIRSNTHGALAHIAWS